MSKLKITLWFTCLFITCGTFYMMVIGTTPPGGINGNGNPALLILFGTMIFLIGFYYLTIDITVRLLLKKKNIKMISLYFLISSTAFVVLYFLSRSNAERVRTSLLNSKNEAYSVGWNQFTNTVYFNTYTFFLSFFSCIMLATIITVILFSVRRRLAERDLN